MIYANVIKLIEMWVASWIKLFCNVEYWIKIFNYLEMWIPWWIKLFCNVENEKILN
jgi:hypothetical protein